MVCARALPTVYTVALEVVFRFTFTSTNAAGKNECFATCVNFSRCTTQVLSVTTVQDRRQLIVQSQAITWFAQ
jgi:hypothetical protein